MSGYIVGSIVHFFGRTLAFFSTWLSKAGYGLAIICALLFGFQGGVSDPPAEAKAKYFSGKTSHSRGYKRSGYRSNYRSGRKHISGHKQGRRHYQSRNGKPRGFSQQRHPVKYHQARKPGHKRHGKFAYQPKPYHGPSIIDVQKVLADKRARRSKAGYRLHHHRISRVVINGAAVTPRTNLYRHIERDDATGVSVIYFDKEKCDQGYDCVMRMGLSRSSAKIIVVGAKRAQRPDADHNLPRIIYPPN